jgi:serine/threonine protein kinase
VLNQAADPFGIIGQVLDSQFRVDRLVGEGGFSAVYRGHHLGLDEPIAIKCLKLPPSLARPLVDQFVKRFRDESRILYRLSQGNLNIVRSIAGGTWQSPVGILVPFMILEWMEGRSLANEFTIRRTVGKQGRSLDEVLKVFESAADGSERRLFVRRLDFEVWHSKEPAR